MLSLYTKIYILNNVVFIISLCFILTVEGNFLVDFEKTSTVASRHGADRKDDKPEISADTCDKWFIDKTTSEDVRLDSDILEFRQRFSMVSICITPKHRIMNSA